METTKLPTLILISSDQRLRGKMPSFLLKIQKYLKIANNSIRAYSVLNLASPPWSEVVHWKDISIGEDWIRTPMGPPKLQPHPAGAEGRIPGQAVLSTVECVPLQCSPQTWKVKSLIICFEFHCLSLLIFKTKLLSFQDSSVKILYNLRHLPFYQFGKVSVSCHHFFIRYEIK